MKRLPIIKTILASALLCMGYSGLAEARGYCSPRHVHTTPRLVSTGGVTIKLFNEGWAPTRAGYLPRACEHAHVFRPHWGWTNREAFYALPAADQARHWARHGYRTRHNGWSHHMPR